MEWLRSAKRRWATVAVLGFCFAHAVANEAHKVAIIGTGLPAAFAAASLREELGADAELTVITRRAHVQAKQNLGGNKFGQMPEPLCVVRDGRLHALIEELGLPAIESPLQRFAVFDGKTTRFTYDGLQSMADHDRYSEDWPKLQTVVEGCKSKRAFLQQTVDDREFCRWNASQFLYDTHLQELAHATLGELLQQHGISSTSAVATEVVGVLTSELFNQGLEVNGVAGCDALLHLFDPHQVCFDAADLAQRILAHTNTALLLNTQAFSLRSEDGVVTVGANRTMALGPFDAVLVTDVLELNELFFVAQQEPMEDYRQWMEFTERYEYVVEGKWQADYFEEDEPHAPLLIVPENVAAGFVSIRKLEKGEQKAPSKYLLKTELPLQTVARRDMFGSRSQVLASFQQSPPLPDMNPAFMEDSWGIIPFPVAGHGIHTATQLQWLSFTPDFLAISAQNAARTLVHIQKLGKHSATTNECGGELPAPVVIQPRKQKRMFIPDPDPQVAEKLKQIVTPRSQAASSGSAKQGDEL